MFQDLRFALRLIAKKRWFFAAAIPVLALGIYSVYGTDWVSIAK